jgi:hypothetical protein
MLLLCMACAAAAVLQAVEAGRKHAGLACLLTAAAAAAAAGCAGTACCRISTSLLHCRRASINWLLLLGRVEWLQALQACQRLQRGLQHLLRCRRRSSACSCSACSR